jgi:hypothetical protein
VLADSISIFGTAELRNSTVVLRGRGRDRAGLARGGVSGLHETVSPLSTLLSLLGQFSGNRFCNGTLLFISAIAFSLEVPRLFGQGAQAGRQHAEDEHLSVVNQFRFIENVPAKVVPEWASGFAFRSLQNPGVNITLANVDRHRTIEEHVDAFSAFRVATVGFPSSALQSTSQ